MLAQFADWMDVRTGLISTIVLAAAGYAAKQWGDKMMPQASAWLGLCRETRKNTQAIVELRGESAVVQDQNRMILDHLQVAYAYTDTKGKVYEVSQAWCEMFGCSRDRAMADGWITQITPGDQDRVVKRFMAQVNSRDPKPYSVDFALDYQTAGKRSVIKSQIDPIRDRAGRVVGFRGVSSVLHADPITDETA